MSCERGEAEQVADPKGYPTWRCPPVVFASMSRSEVVEYKYIRSSKKGLVWEPGKNRTILLGDCDSEETITVQDGHFNLADARRSRESHSRVRKLKAVEEPPGTPRKTMAAVKEEEEAKQAMSPPKSPASPGTPQKLAEAAKKLAAEAAKREQEELEAKLAAQEKEALLLAAEVEALKASMDKDDGERLQKELSAERAERAALQAKDDERNRQVSEELHGHTRRAADLEAQLKSATAEAEEVEVLKAELGKEKEGRASSRTRRNRELQELERQAEEQALQERDLKLQRKLTPDSPFSEALTQARTALLEEVAYLRSAAQELSKVEAGELQAIGALRDAQAIEAEVELDVLDRVVHEVAGLRLEASRGAEARLQRKLADQAREECDRQHRELSREARRLLHRARELQLQASPPTPRSTRPLAMFMLAFMALTALGAIVAPASQRLKAGGWTFLGAAQCAPAAARRAPHRGLWGWKLLRGVRPPAYRGDRAFLAPYGS